MTTNDDSSPDLILIARGDGEHFDIAGARLTWKVKAEMTQDRFCFFEQVLPSGDTVPLHRHGFTESFYILSGNVTFAGATTNSARLLAKAGDVVVARPGAFHQFSNQDPGEARLLSISVPEHQRFFDAVATADREVPFATMAPDAAMQRVAAIGAETDALFVNSG